MGKSINNMVHVRVRKANTRIPSFGSVIPVRGKLILAISTPGRTGYDRQLKKARSKVVAQHICTVIEKKLPYCPIVSGVSGR